jgi:conjugative relaxase-like TrwC/TraI family protein
MRMMGSNSVEYHRQTVMGRADDFSGQALDYYGSRGETPLVWGGSGARRLGLSGRVTDAQYVAIYGPGGACDPTTGARLVATRRPGMEIVISAHKSVAELGVVGRAEDMHAVMDAERDATLAYLDSLTRERGGRRGRAGVRVATSGMVYAHSRHATSRAGDPCPHDHVLVANVVEMLDGASRWKAADTALWRDHLHAATVVGRTAAARVAVELGYAIEADHGPSGRLGHWRIVGIPDEVLEVHSKRAAEIDAEMARRGTHSYQARNLVARDTRRAKRHTPVGELMPGWRSELAEVGWTVERLNMAVEQAAHHAELPRPLSHRELTMLVDQVVAAEGPLATRKVFSAPDVTVAVAPHLYGRPVDDLERAVRAVLRSPELVPLLGVVGARERMYATAATLATEAAIADLVARGATTAGAAVVHPDLVASAIARVEARLARPLTAGQAAAVRGICGEGRRVSLILGVAGSGKTTALRAAADAYRTTGYDVVGTATSGQAARTLGREAALDHSRTLASLLWRLDHGQLALGARTVVLLDEAGMTNDPALLRLLAAAQVSGAKVVLVGDDRQLGAVGPGGALGALFDRHQPLVHVLSENVRQDDPDEGAALGELRSGHVGAAVDWYVDHDRVRVSPDRESAIREMVDAWATDALAGREAALYAWRRANVDDLNRGARDAWALAGRLHGPYVTAPGGRCYAAGDRIVTLAPGEDGRLVTSQHGVVTEVHPATQTFSARMDDDSVHAFSRAEMAKDRLAHGYALTVHRSQGDTVDVAHRLEDGGGRELAYVSMSRARRHSTVHVVADDLDQAREDLAREWASERRPRWAIDSGTPATRPRDVEAHPGVPAPMRSALRRARLEAEHQAVAGAVPPDVRADLWRANHELLTAEKDRQDLDTGHGCYLDTDLGHAAHRLRDARSRARQAERFAEDPNSSRRNRRYWRHQASEWRAEEAEARRSYDELAEPERVRLDSSIDELSGHRDELRARVVEREAWLDQHSEAARRLRTLQHEIDALDREARPDTPLSRVLDTAIALSRQPHRTPELGRTLDYGIDLGL